MTLEKIKPLVLISNDDGIHSVALEILAQECGPYADVWIVAPDQERSAQSLALTVNTHLKINKFSDQKFSISGTPVDCVTVALSKILPRNPDFIFSGINWGANLGRDTLFSGTVGIGSASALHGIRACAFSCEITHPKSENERWQKSSYNFSACRHVIRELWKKEIFSSIQSGTVLNINIPSMDAKELKGMQLSELGKSGYDHKIIESKDPRGRSMFWYSGKREQDLTEAEGLDHVSLESGFASMTVLVPKLFHKSAHDSFCKDIAGKGFGL